jgi:hypothetical protein
MRTSTRPSIALAVVAVLILAWTAGTDRDLVSAQTRKRVVMTRLYTGADNRTHAEDIELPFAMQGTRDVSALMKISGAELHRIPAGNVNDFHPAPQRQYVITISGRGEIELADGRKIALEPGHIELAEDVTGQGHITRAVGPEDRITLWLPLADQKTK